MGLFKPAWQSNDKQKRVEAVQNLNDKSILLEIMRDDESDEAPLAASRFIEILLTEPPQAALPQLDELLPNYQPWLLDYIGGCQHIEAAEQALRKITYHGNCTRLIEELPDSELRSMAVKRRNVLLYRCYKNEQDGGLRSNIESDLALLDEQELLQKLAMKSPNTYVRNYCAERLAEPARIADLVLSASEEIPLDIIDRIDAPDTLRRIVRESAVGSIRLQAAMRLGDKNLLQELAVSDYMIAEEIARETTDPEMMACIIHAWSGITEPVRLLIDRVTDRALLKEIALNVQHYERLSDQTTYPPITFMNRYEWDQGDLVEIASNAVDYRVKSDAIALIEDAGILLELQKNCDGNKYGDADILYTLEKRLSELEQA